MAATFATVDEYIGSFPEDVQARLQQVRQSIRAAVPDGDEKISYGIPAVSLDGRYVVYFAGWKQHVSVYPLPTGDAAFRRELAPYISGKGTAKFPLAEPIPYDLIGRLAAFLVEERAAGRK